MHVYAALRWAYSVLCWSSYIALAPSDLTNKQCACVYNQRCRIQSAWYVRMPCLWCSCSLA